MIMRATQKKMMSGGDEGGGQVIGIEAFLLHEFLVWPAHGCDGGAREEAGVEDVFVLLEAVFLDWMAIPFFEGAVVDIVLARFWGKGWFNFLASTDLVHTNDGQFVFPVAFDIRIQAPGQEVVRPIVIRQGNPFVPDRDPVATRVGGKYTSP